ncbi:MAG TPA: MFS transporter [Pirellulaceae bacterium]|nr:MFS transporter [Pirellulaceae bacterium]
MTITQWLICVIAAIGFAFDIYELLMLPLIARPALLELGGIRPGTTEFTTWISLLFYIPAVAGGIFGLMGGYLTDRLGRRRVLTWSILLYAGSAFAAGFSTNLYMLLLFRCLVFVGVCVEFVAAVAWLAELFDNPKRREAVLGFTQAFSSIGGLSVAIAGTIVAGWAVNKSPTILFGLITLPALQLPEVQLPNFLSFLGEIKNGHADWRYLLMSGLIPAIPLIVIRPFLPESPAWQKKRESGTLRRPNIAELFAPKLRRTTLITTLMFTCSFAAAFGAIQQMPLIVPGLPDVRAASDAALEKGFPKAAQEGMRKKLIADGKTEEAADKAVLGKMRSITGPVEQPKITKATEGQEIGGLVGRFAIAILLLFIVSRQALLRMFLVPGLIAMPLIFGWAAVTDLHYLEIGMFIAGFLTVAQFSFWGNYLPHAFPVHLRGTGEGFAANIGGRLIGTCFFGVTQWIAFFLPATVGSYNTRVAYTAAGVAFTVYLINFLASFWLPEPDLKSLEE